MQVFNYTCGEQGVVAHLCPLTKARMNCMAIPIIIPAGAKAMPLNKGVFTIVDESDYEWLSRWKWYLAEKGYAKRSAAKSEGIGHSAFFMHRIILNTPKGLMSDHINRNKLDNRRCNLRIVTHQQNGWNSGTKCNHTSKYKGVNFHKKSGKWQARIKLNRQETYIGIYETPEAAAMAYNDFARKYHGEWAFINEIPITLSKDGKAS